MSVSTIVARIDEQDKKEFNNFCSAVGLNASTALNLFIKAVIRENCIPFAISRKEEHFYNPANQAYIVKELKAGKKIQPREHIESNSI